MDHVNTTYRAEHPIRSSSPSPRERAPDAEDFGDAPGLGDGAAGEVRRVALEDLGDAAEACVVEVVRERD